MFFRKNALTLFALIALSIIAVFAHSTEVLTKSEKKACTQFSTSISELSKAIRKNPETQSLSHWSSNGITFKGLAPDVFRGRRIAFVGDSTLLYMHGWLAALLRLPEKKYNQTWSALHLSIANKVVEKKKGGEIPLSLPDGTSAIWSGFMGPGGQSCNLTNHWTQVKQINPEILIVNMGLHWLHLGKTRFTQPCTLVRWLNYESWLDEVIYESRLMNVKLLLLKTTNMVCHEKYHGEYATQERLFREKDTGTLQACYELMHSQVPEASMADVRKYCEFGTMNNIGSIHLNRRLFKYVKKRIKSKLRKSSLRVEIFDDNRIQHCNYTKDKDGRHFHPLNMMRLRLLGNYITCFAPLF